MASKSRGGFSKREVAAQKKAKPKVSTRAAAAKSSSKGYSDPTLAAEMNPVGATINPGRQNQPLVVNDSGPLQQGQKRSSAKTDNKGSSKSSSSKKPSLLAGGLFGTPSVSADTGPKEINITPIATGKNTLGKFLTGARAAASVLPGMGTLRNVGDLNISERLGFNTKDYGMSIPTDETGAVLGVQDQGIVNDIVRENSGVLPDDAVDLLQQGRNRQKARSVFQDEGFGAASQFVNNSPTNSTTRTPRAVAGGYTPAPQASYQPESQVTPYRPELDFTPTSQGQPGTQRRFLGNGYLSNGIASNGKLDSGFDGASFGVNPMDTEENLLNQLLGIPTAQAQEMPQAPFSFDQVTPMSAFQQSFANGGLTLDQGSTLPQEYTIPSNPVTNRGSNAPAPAQVNTQNPGGSTNGGVTQQYAQGATGGSPLEGYYSQAQKGLKAQEKAQKKALNELLKSIRNQYKTSQESGLSELAKSKQQDLLKLSGLFSFANQDPNSEQRIQYETRLADDNARQQADFLAKLAAAQSQEESGARQGYQKEIANLADRRSQMQLELAKLLEDARQQQMNRSGKDVAAEKNDSLTYLGDDANGNPVYWNNRTKQQFVGSGLTRKSADPFAALLGGLGLNGTTPQ